MTMNEFAQLAQTWGGDLARWPEEVRGAAEAIAHGSQGAQALLEEARRLDDQIAGLTPDISPERVGRAVFAVANTIAGSTAPRRSPTRLWLRWLMPATGFACAALIGVSLAITYPVDLMHRGADAGTIFALLLDNSPAEQDWTLQ